ncbi:MAG TPA: hypothetical protein VGP90_04695, partial [Acidimicrobiia bacterium]|nr:hypothetical protein [Acidimicrobiia bacterium]
MARKVVVAVVLATAGFGLPARALTGGGAAGPRVAVLRVDHGPAGAIGAAEVPLPFPATHVGLRWRGGETDDVELRWLRAGQWGPWQRTTVWDDAGDDDAGIMASGLVRPDAGTTRLAIRWPAGATHLEAVVIDAGSDRLPLRPARVADGKPAEPPVITRREWGANEGLRKGRPEFA